MIYGSTHKLLADAVERLPSSYGASNLALARRLLQNARMNRQPVNPAGPMYRIPAGTPAAVSRKGRPQEQRFHETRRELTFDSCLSFLDPGFIVFETDGWVLAVSQELVIETHHPRVLAVYFSLVTDSAHLGLISWPDVYGDSDGLRAIDARKSLLDVTSGDRIHWITDGSNEIHIVREVFINRSWPPFPEYEAVPCGRWFLEKFRVQ